VKIGVPKETAAGERRVALVPDTVGRLAGDGVVVVVEPSAGVEAGFTNEAYADAGAELGDAWAPDLVLKVQRPTDEEVERLRSGQVLVGLLQPLVERELAEALAARGVTSFSLDAIPRITRAQSMDALSSQATVSGYKAAVVAAERLVKFFPMLTTAAGTIAPAKVLVLGAGVAGLQAIATARRLGAVVSAYDVRPVVKEQVESLGATFLELDVEGAEGTGGYAVALAEDQHEREQELLALHVAESDAVIATALHARAVADVHSLEIEAGVVAQPLKVLIGTLPRQVVENGDTPVAGAEEAGGVAAYEPGATGDQYPFHRYDSLPHGCSITVAVNAGSMLEVP